MKTCSTGLAAHINQGQTTLATLLNVVRQYDAAVYGFTEHDKDIVYSAVTYKSTTSYNRFNLNAKFNAESNTTELTGAFDSVITRADALAGLWDNAQLTLYLVNWSNLSQGAMILDTGSFGEFEVNEFGFKVSLHGLAFLLTFMGGELCAPTCRSDFGAATLANGQPGCAPGGALADGTTINSLIQTGTVVTTDGTRNLTASGLTNTGKPFNGGYLSWATGNNTLLTAETLEVEFFPSANTTIVLRPNVLLQPIQVGDTFKLSPSCDKTELQCGIWKNILNFVGEPNVPDPGAILQYPDYVPPHT